MLFRLPVDGLQLEFQITHYSKSKKECWEDQWCEVGFCIDDHHGFRYAFYENYMILLSAEVEEIEENLTLLLEDKLEQEKVLEFLEPNFQMTLYPTTDLYGIKLEWRIYFWDEGTPTESHIALAMYREDITYLRDYLRLVTRMIKPDQEQTWHILDPVNYPSDN
jgi:hypothetical protein